MNASLHMVSRPTRVIVVSVLVGLAVWLGVAVPEATGNTAAPEMTLLGGWTTHFIPGPTNGDGVNIRIPAERIDGTIVKPGHRFGFIRAVSPVTSPPYRLGGVLRGGRIDEQGVVGGGMCSASTTLFNAAMRAGLKIVERHPHAIYISRYPVGLDATVFGRSGRGQDVVFLNDLAHPVLIRGIGARRSVTFEIYGVDEGRTVHISEPRIDNRIHAKNWLEYTNDLRPGKRHKVNDPYDGFESWVTVTVRDQTGGDISTVTYHSKYRRLDGLIMLGRRPGDPPPGTRVPA